MGFGDRFALAASHRIPRPDDGHATGIEGVGRCGEWQPLDDYQLGLTTIITDDELIAIWLVKVGSTLLDSGFINPRCIEFVCHSPSSFLIITIASSGIDPNKIGDTPESPFGNGTASIWCPLYLSMGRLII